MLTTRPPKKSQPRKRRSEPRQWVTLGSADPDPSNPYRMLVTLSNEGASVARLELSSERYRDLDDRSGYLGHLVMDNSDQRPGLPGAGGRGGHARGRGRRAGPAIAFSNWCTKETTTRRSTVPRAWNSPSARPSRARPSNWLIQRGNRHAFPTKTSPDPPSAGSDSPRAEKAEHGLDQRRPAGCDQPEGELPALVPDDIAGR